MHLTEAPIHSSPCVGSGPHTPVAAGTLGASDDCTNLDLVDRVLGEYREMPGLALTLDQARRLWGCDDETCRRLADVLVNRRVLRWSRDGRLVRAN